ncbi:hypothetical protein ScPMuIL_004968 [Solemya velum]
MATYEWYPKRRDYEAEKLKEVCAMEAATNHPLKTIRVVEMKTAERRGTPSKTTPTKASPMSDFIDPLSMCDPLSAALDGSHPLSVSAAQAGMPTRTKNLQNKVSMHGDKDYNNLDETFEPWVVRKNAILTKYTTSEKLSITTSFLSSSDKERVIIKTQASSTVTDKVKNRLEQLDDFEEGSVQEMLNLTQQDYIKRIDELNQALIHAWNLDQRVKALKIAIQCSKLLSDISVIQFYPSKFVLITDILDTFGKLVYERLFEKAQYTPKGSGVPIRLPENFTPDQVSESAKETCRNWFFKIASIREMIPRFYVETAILKCYGFLNVGEYDEALRRLASMIRGIGDPLVAVYARCYLCRVGIIVSSGTRDHIMPCFDDFLTTYFQVQGDSVQNTLAMQKLEMPRYLTLFSPALDWILQCVAHRAPENTLKIVLQKCKEQCNSALLLNSILSAFKPEFISVRATECIEMIRDCEDMGFPKHLLHRSLGLCLVLAAPPENQRLTVLNDVWKVILKLKNPADYIGCAEVWVEYVVKHFGNKELNTVLGDIIKHMSPDRAYEDFYAPLQSVITKILCHIHDFSQLFSLDKFLPFIDMFQKESVKIDVCKSIMESFIKHQAEPTNDPVIINALMFVCKTMHDSVNALTLEDEKRAIGHLICGFILKISFGRDFEQQLSFFVESRSSFSNIDAVLIQLIQSVNNLSMETRKVVKGNHSRKTANFVRACAAYCFITIPSLQSVYCQLQLYLLCGQGALLNQCFSQADAFFKAAISLIPSMPKMMDFDGKVRSTETFLMDYIQNFVSTLLTVPDNPDSGVLYLLRGLINIVQNYTWDVHSSGKVLVYLRVIAILSASCQEVYCYRVDKVDANDALYGNDPKFLSEARSMCSTLVDEVLSQLKLLSDSDSLKKQGSLTLELLNTIISHGDLSQPSMVTLAVNLWGLAQKHGQTDSKQKMKVLDTIRIKSSSENGSQYRDLLNQLPVETRT